MGGSPWRGAKVWTLRARRRPGYVGSTPPGCLSRRPFWSRRKPLGSRGQQWPWTLSATSWSSSVGRREKAKPGATSSRLRRLRQRSGALAQPVARRDRRVERLHRFRGCRRRAGRRLDRRLGGVPLDRRRTVSSHSRPRWRWRMERSRLRPLGFCRPEPLFPRRRERRCRSHSSSGVSSPSCTNTAGSGEASDGEGVPTEAVVELAHASGPSLSFGGTAIAPWRWEAIFVSWSQTDAGAPGDIRGLTYSPGAPASPPVDLVHQVGTDRAAQRGRSLSMRWEGR